jgi:hypothetical protein
LKAEIPGESVRLLREIRGMELIEPSVTLITRRRSVQQTAFAEGALYRCRIQVVALTQISGERKQNAALVDAAAIRKMAVLGLYPKTFATTATRRFGDHALNKDREEVSRKE